MITEVQVQESIDFLFASAIDAAQARADRAALEQGLKRIRAVEMLASKEKSSAAQETVALASDNYRVALDGFKAAVYADEKMRALRDAHAARIDAWRTQSATVRSVRL
jgi:hypothetical protein